MRKFTVKIYELEEAFFDTLMSIENKEIAKRTFSEMIDKDDGKYDFMIDFLTDYNDFYHPIPDEIRVIFELDAGAYYMEN